MHLRLIVDDADESPIGELRNELIEDPELRSAQIHVVQTLPEPGTLGVAEILEFVGSDVLLPVVISAVYDWFKERRDRKRNTTLTVTVMRTDLPDGGREV